MDFPTRDLAPFALCFWPLQRAKSSLRLWGRPESIFEAGHRLKPHRLKLFFRSTYNICCSFPRRHLLQVVDHGVCVIIIYELGSSGRRGGIKVKFLSRWRFWPVGLFWSKLVKV